MQKEREQKRRQAFVEAMKKVEAEHGYRLMYYQPPVQARIEKFEIPKVDPELARKAAKMAGYEMPKPEPWWKRLFTKKHEDGKADQVQE